MALARAELAKATAVLWQDKKLEQAKAKKGRLTPEQRAHYEKRVQELERALDSFHRSVASVNRTKAMYVPRSHAKAVDGLPWLMMAMLTACRSRCCSSSRSPPSSRRGASTLWERTTTTLLTATCNLVRNAASDSHPFPAFEALLVQPRKWRHSCKKRVGTANTTSALDCNHSSLAL